MKITVIAFATQWSMPFSMNTRSYINYVSTRFLETATRWRRGGGEVQAELAPCSVVVGKMGENKKKKPNKNHCNGRAQQGVNASNI